MQPMSEWGRGTKILETGVRVEKWMSLTGGSVSAVLEDVFLSQYLVRISSRSEGEIEDRNGRDWSGSSAFRR